MRYDGSRYETWESWIEIEGPLSKVINTPIPPDIFHTCFFASYRLVCGFHFIYFS